MQLQDIVSAGRERMILVAVWVFVLFNYAYADIVMMIFHPEAYQRVAEGMSQWTTLGAAALMEILIAMPLLTVVLSSRINRWANIVGGVIGTLFVGITLSPRVPLFYLFFAVIEIISTLFVIWYAWKWKIE